AEDGIRDFHVTGVQTCALPISAHWYGRSRAHRASADGRTSLASTRAGSGSHCSPAADRHRPRRAVFPAGSRIVSAVIAEHAACQLAYVSADLTALQGLLDRRDAVQIDLRHGAQGDRKSTRLNSSHVKVSY